jgi:hypothetical protein
MAKDRQADEPPEPPRWQQGELEMLIPVAEEVRSRLGPPSEVFDGENIRLVLRWSVTPTRPLTADEHLFREMELAVQKLEDAEWALTSPDRTTSRLPQDLVSALNYAVSAWFYSAFHKGCASYGDAHYAFLDRAPADVRAIVSKAGCETLRLDPPASDLFDPYLTPHLPDDDELKRIAADVRAAVEAIFDLIVAEHGRGREWAEQLRARARGMNADASSAPPRGR